MTDREKVIKGLECCQLDVNKCLDCPYLDKQNKVAECGIELHRDALALLKEQEAMCPKLGGNDGPFGTHWYQCGACSGHINPGNKYCSSCGRAVKWE